MSQPYGPSWPVTGIALPLLYKTGKVNNILEISVVYIKILTKPDLVLESHYLEKQHSM
jgi:hypothetical protein